MIVRAKPSALKEGRWYEYVIRFGLGGLTTLIAGFLADIWGPETRVSGHLLRERDTGRRP